jgi:hypothetical protein
MAEDGACRKPSRARALRTYAVYGGLAMGLGVAVSALLSGRVDARVVGGGCVVGLSVFLSALGLDCLAEPLYGRLNKRAAWAARFFVYAVAGTAGSAFGVALVRMLFYGLPFAFPGLGLTLGIAAALALAVGLPAQAYEHLHTRLAESIEKLKEAEFAEKELEMARALQKRLLPPPLFEGGGYAIAARNLAARVVAGDFYDIFPLEFGQVGVAVADVSGKGMAASLIMASAKAVLPLVAAGRGPAETLRLLNDRLKRDLGRREFVALVYAVFDPRTGRVTLANAGMPDPYVMRAGQPPRAVAAKGPRFPLGLRAGVLYEEVEAVLGPSDRLLLVSDGLPEAPLPGGEPIGYEGFEALLGLDGGTASETLDLLLARLGAAARLGEEDDGTALLLERT